MDKNYIGDTPGMGQCFCSGACEKLGYCPNVTGGRKDDWHLVPTTQETYKTTTVYVAVTGEDYHGIVFVLGVANTKESAREIVDDYCRNSTFLPDWVRILEYPVGAKWDGDLERKTVLYLRKEERMMETGVTQDATD